MSNTNIFDFIKSNLSILDVIGQYSTLKRAGQYWKGHCPFHHEKTASFTVSPHREIFYCFGCNAGGDVISFIAKAENCSQIEAAKQLAQQYNLDVPEDVNFDNIDAQAREKETYNTICKLVTQWAHENLKRNKKLLQYLEQRGFTKKTIDYFSIGYFSGGLKAIQTLTKYMSTHNILAKDLIDAQILSAGKTVLYSPFEERILFPIKDHLGRFCGFGGRVFKEHDDRPKYYNSRENDFFNKGSLLFGLDRAKKAIQKSETVFLVEGYTDCMAMVQHGYSNTIATLGTSCTADHLKKLARYAHRLYVLYDGDQAGQKAILRLTELCWHVSIEPYVVVLPQNEDPATFLHKGGDLQELINQSQDIFVFFIESLGHEFATKALSEKISLIKKLTQTIKNLDDPLKQDILLQKASKTLDIPFESLQRELRKTWPSKKTTQAPDAPPNIVEFEDEIGSSKLEKKIFCAIIYNMKLLGANRDHYLIEYLPNPLRDILKRLQVIKRESPQGDFARFFSTLTEQEKRYVSRLLLEYDEVVSPETLEQLLMQLHKKNWKIIVQDIKIRLAHAKKEGNADKVNIILKDFLNLKQKLVDKNFI